MNHTILDDNHRASPNTEACRTSVKPCCCFCSNFGRKSRPHFAPKWNQKSISAQNDRLPKVSCKMLMHVLRFRLPTGLTDFTCLFQYLASRQPTFSCCTPGCRDGLCSGHQLRVCQAQAASIQFHHLRNHHGLTLFKGKQPLKTL